MVPLFLYVTADGLMLPHLVSTALEPFQECAGTASAIAGFWRFFSAAVIALAVSAASTLHLLVLHLGTAAMAIVSGILYLVTLLGADSSEFTRNNARTRAMRNAQTLERKPLIDMSEAQQHSQKYGLHINDQRGNITVEPDSE